MVPRILQILEFDWDDDNVYECARHHLSPKMVTLILRQLPLFFLNKPGKSGTHVMIGAFEPGQESQLWTVILLETNTQGRWRPITGWPSEPPEILVYQRWIGKTTRSKK